MENAQWIGSLVARYERPLCRYAFSLTGSATLAQDAVQETFLRLCKANRAKVEGHEAAWLFRVCRSRVFDIERKEKPVKSLTASHAAGLAAPDPAGAEAAHRAEEEHLLLRLMARLPARQAEAIRLKFQQRLSYRDIARVMDVSESNVGYLIHVGIKSLRDHARGAETDSPLEFTP
ncbi:MAG: sigma-70 family RNA polymerase sigma factor [Thermoguttaceae bacterium]|jgi:RNA polymerase sigma-70 factor (ECF subfamily)|nr:sigma-70 family RNA polymerase sigma factor [Thermoguttaceae bacterium]